MAEKMTRGQIQDLVGKFASENPKYRTALLSNPKATIEKQLNTTLGAVNVKAVADTADTVHVVIPYAAAERGHLKPVGQWNEEEVTVTGSTIRVVLNGHQILDADLSKVTTFMADSAHPGKDRTEGYFGFAGHQDPVRFRHIRIRELP